MVHSMRQITTETALISLRRETKKLERGSETQRTKGLNGDSKVLLIEI